MPSRSCPQRFGRSMRPLFVGHPAHAQGGGASRGHPCLAGRGLAWKGARHQWVGGAVVGGEVAPSRTRRGCVKMGGHFRGALFPAGGGSRWPPLLRCSGGGHPVRSPWGSYANGTCGVVHPAGLEPACPWATPFEGVVYPGSTTDACSPCLLVKGTDCAGVILARLRGWWSRSLVPVLGTSPLDGQSPHRAMFAYPCSGKTTVGRLVGCM